MSDTDQWFETGLTADDHPMSRALGEDFVLNVPVQGEVRRGEVVADHGNTIMIDIGAKSEALVDPREVERLDKATRARLEVGEEIDVYIVNPEDGEGNIIVSVTRALEEQDWREASELMESQEVFESAIVGFNKGGVIVRLGQLRGFVPLSQLNLARGLGRDADAVNQALRPLVGKPVFVKVIEVSRERNRLILSERAAAREARASRRANLLDKLDVGETRTGRVVNLADFGAFVDIGGIEGLVHLSELSWRRVGKPGDVVQVGDEVEVYVLNVDEDKQRVALSMKRLMPDPWDNIHELYQEGQLVEALVTKLVKFGAFASLNDDYGLEGLIHISELSEEHVKFPADVVKKGQTVTARIIRIDPDQRQIGLSLKQVTSDAFMEFDMAQVQQDE